MTDRPESAADRSPHRRVLGGRTPAPPRVAPARVRPPRPILRAAPAVLLGAAIAYFALRSSPYLQYIPWMPRGLGEWADRNGILRNGVAFLVLGVVVFLLVGRRPWQVGALAAFGAGIEIAQVWIPGRVFDWRDIVASVLGVLLAWPLAWFVRRHVFKRCSPDSPRAD